MLPNIGLFLCRGNSKTAKVFELSWEKYQMMEDGESKKNPGKDQNHVLEVFFFLNYCLFYNKCKFLMTCFTIEQCKSMYVNVL